jgi:hypothetical protein
MLQSHTKKAQLLQFAGAASSNKLPSLDTLNTYSEETPPKNSKQQVLHCCALPQQ